MAEFIYTMKKARKAHGDKVILDDVTLMFLPGAKIGVVGPNGAGKSTVLQIMAGLQQPSNGEAYLTPGYTVGILLQEPPLNEEKNVLENVQEGVAEIMNMLNRFNEISELMSAPDADYDTLLGEMGDLQEKLDHANAWEIDSRLEQAMDALRCPPPDADVKVLSGGERRRVALCKLLLQAPDLLLLDEPTNHLDAESVLWLEQHLAKYNGTVVAITHDRYFLDNVAQWILELDRGRAYPYEGNYSTYLETKAQRLKIEGQKDAKRAKRLAEELAQRILDGYARAFLPAREHCHCACRCTRPTRTGWNPGSAACNPRDVFVFRRASTRSSIASRFSMPLTTAPAATAARSGCCRPSENPPRGRGNISWSSRPFAAGDRVKHVNWRAWLRLGTTSG